MQLAKKVKLIKDPSAVLMMGKMGSGKTSLGYLLLEQSNLKNKFAVLPALKDGYSVAWNNVPRDIITPVAFTEDVLETLPSNSAVFIDDASVVLYARDSGKSQNKLIDKAVLMSRQKRQTLIFSTHNARKIDVGVLGEISTIFIKEPAFLQEKIERNEFKMYVKEAKIYFDKVKESDRKKCAFVISGSAGKFLQIPQASFWKEELGMVWEPDESDATVDDVVIVDDSHIKRVYKVFVDTGYPLTTYAIKSKIGGGITINDVIRSVAELMKKKIICTVPNKGTLDKYRLV